jgi:hypothetical protein
MYKNNNNDKTVAVNDKVLNKRSIFDNINL